MRKDFAMVWSTMYKFGAVTVCYIILGVYCTHTDLNEYWFTSSKVITKEMVENGGDCTDGDGNVYTHLQEWTDAVECANYTCFQASSDNFIVKSSCRKPLQAENPDSENCIFLTDNTAVYPHCCPVLDCPEREANGTNSTAPAPSCYDRASNQSCFVWKYLNGCDIQNDTFNLFNFTWVYCRQTCAFC